MQNTSQQRNNWRVEFIIKLYTTTIPNSLLPTNANLYRITGDIFEGDLAFS